MKKIFTSLFCILAVGLFAHADDNALIDQCINTVLGGDNVTATIATPNMDVNNDGAINITDITIMINQDIQNRKAKAPARLPQFKSAKIAKITNNEDGTKTVEATDESTLGENKDK